MGGALAALDAAVGQAAIGVVVFDTEGRYVYLNATAAAFSGISPEAHLGRTIADVAPAAATVLEPLVARAAAGEPVTDVEVTVADGQRLRTSLGSLIPYHGEQGDVVAVVALFWELTERIEADARFRLLADAAPVLMWTMDADGRCDWLSGGWGQFVGIPVEEQVGAGWTRAVHPDDLDRAMGEMREAFARREAFDVEFRVRRADGELRWILDRGNPRFDVAGTFVGYVGTCTDIHELRVAQDRMASLQRVTEAFARSLTSSDVAAAVVEHAVVAAGAVAGSLCLLDDEGMVRVERAIGYPAEVLESLSTFPIDADMPMSETIRTGRPVLVDAVPDVPAGTWAAFVQATMVTGTAAAATLPVTVDGKIVGALGLSFDGAQRFDDASRDFLMAIAAQCGSAMERAALYDAEEEARRAAERTRERLAFLAEAGRLLAGRLSREEILQRVTDLAGTRLAPWVALYLEQDGVLRRATVAHDPGLGDAAGVLAPDAVPVVADLSVARSFRSGRPVLIDVVDREDLDAYDPDIASVVRSLEVASAVFAPVRARSSTLGVLCLSRFEGQAPFDERDVSVAVELAARAGLAVENADLYEQEHRIAETLQRAVLPSRLPDVPGAEVAARYLPGAAGVEVGGDWYDAFDLRDGRVGIVIGDVAGHGLRAAAVMGQLRNALRAYAVDGDEPNVVLHRLTRLLHEERDAPFATAIYGVYDPPSGRLVLSNAGHPAPLRVSGSGVEPVGMATAPPLGVSSAAPGDDLSVSLEPGDLLLLYTDGLVERRNEHLDAGIARLTRTLSALPARHPVHHVCDTVVSDVLRGAVQEDDVCVLALRRL